MERETVELERGTVGCETPLSRKREEFSQERATVAFWGKNRMRVFLTRKKEPREI